MKMYDLRDNEMMKIDSLTLEGGNLVARGKIMGAMPIAASCKPEELIAGMRLLSWSIIGNMPILLIKGIVRTLFGSKKKGRPRHRRPLKPSTAHRPRPNRNTLS